MKSLKKWFKSKSMNTQIGICNLFLATIFILVFTIAFVTHRYILMPLLTTSQEQLFSQSSRQSLSSILAQKENLLRTFLDQKTNQLMSLYQLSLEGQKMLFNNGDQDFIYDNQEFKEIPTSLLDLTPTFDAQMTNSFMCSSNKTKFDSINYQKRSQLIEFSNLMGAVGQIYNTQTFGRDQFTYGAIFTDPQILFSYPCFYLGAQFDSFVPNNRPWYIYAEQIYQELQANPKQQIAQLTEPYVLFTSHSIDISLVIPQVDLENRFIGAWGIDFQGSMFAKYIQTSDIKDMILMVTKSGILLVHNFDNPDQILPLYIYNETVTGYTQTDWELIMNNQDSNNSCNQQYSIPGYFCRYNNKLQKDLHVISSYIQKYQIYIVIISDQSINEQVIKIENLKLNQFFFDQFIQFLSQSTWMISIYIFATFIILSVSVTNPIKNVINLINKYLEPKNHNHIEKQRLLIRVFNSEDVQKLLSAFNTLLRTITISQMTKNNTCQLMEKFKYQARRIKQQLPFANTYKQLQDDFQNPDIYTYTSNKLQLCYRINSTEIQFEISNRQISQCKNIPVAHCEKMPKGLELQNNLGNKSTRLNSYSGQNGRLPTFCHSEM